VLLSSLVVPLVSLADLCQLGKLAVVDSRLSKQPGKQYGRWNERLYEMRNARKQDFEFFGFKGKGLFWTASVVLALVVAVPAGALWAQGPVHELYNEDSAKYVRTSFTPNDPLYTGGQSGNTYGQWHLNGNNGYSHINVAGAWANDYTGTGVTIGIVDDCFETAHPDLAPNYVAGVSWDFGQNDSDPNPVYSADQHGISVAGVAAGRGGNGVGITGVAPHASLAGLRCSFGANQTEQMFANATTYRTDVIKVKNHSYGIAASYVSNPTIVTANRTAAAAGCVNVRAAGNDSANANAKTAQADRTAIAVAALGANGVAASYSNFGANVFVTAPSNGGGPGITTTDRTGSSGYGGITGHPDYTNAFGGTSSASPTVAGTVALILQANSNLDVRGVKHVLANTSVKFDTGHSAWQTNGAGYEFNPYYGFGLIDATAAVNYALSYAGPAAEVSFGTGQQTVNQTIPDAGSAVSRTFTITDTNRLESIELDIGLSSNAYWGDYDILLTSPSGTTSKLGYGLTTGQGDSTTWEFSSAEFWGENPNGQWTVSVQDIWAGYTGTWNSFEFTGYAEAPEPATMSLLAIGGLALLRRRRRKAA